MIVTTLTMTVGALVTTERPSVATFRRARELSKTHGTVTLSAGGACVTYRDGRPISPGGSDE